MPGMQKVSQPRQQQEADAMMLKQMIDEVQQSDESVAQVCLAHAFVLDKPSIIDIAMKPALHACSACSLQSHIPETLTTRLSPAVLFHDDWFACRLLLLL